ncbi:redoxin domain-containing protein [Oscillatoria sp. FACHB-1406]|uniref:peroxiredoxin family protein n=1 Tax=Oscillatoria sp. FACHB-1406 TaxID=2692846 RepID=UPI001686A990|nr:redoxin domain-containing protein [Oscillatoria sp. FACHB-1406]MBD2578721.1 redoxin domain-containing protein [Oscillatoria sp. FACHB-1406]
MLTSLDFRGLFNARFARNFFPIPATSSLAIGQNAPDLLLPDITNQSTVRLSDYRGKQPIVLAFTRIFTEKQYCPLCYPHIIELNDNYERFSELGVEVLMITSTDTPQSRQVVRDLGLKMPLLSNPSCDVFRTYQVGQALGAPLPAQFILDRQGKLRYKHLFSFLAPNAPVETLITLCQNL